MAELSWGTLPGEVLVQIFSYLHYRDTVMAGRVCRHWSAVSRDPLLLAAIVQRDFSPEFVARVVNCVVVGLVKSGHLPSEVGSSIFTLFYIVTLLHDYMILYPENRVGVGVGYYCYGTSGHCCLEGWGWWPPPLCRKYLKGSYNSKSPRNSSPEIDILNG